MIRDGLGEVLIPLHFQGRVRRQGLPGLLVAVRRAVPLAPHHVEVAKGHEDPGALRRHPAVAAARRCDSALRRVMLHMGSSVSGDWLGLRTRAAAVLPAGRSQQWRAAARPCRRVLPAGLLHESRGVLVHKPRGLGLVRAVVPAAEFGERRDEVRTVLARACAAGRRPRSPGENWPSRGPACAR